MAPASEIIDVQVASRRSRAASPALHKSTGDQDSDKIMKVGNENANENIANTIATETWEPVKKEHRDFLPEGPSTLRMRLASVKNRLFGSLCRRRCMAACLLCAFIAVGAGVFISGKMPGFGYEVAGASFHNLFNIVHIRIAHVAEQLTAVSPHVLLATIVGTVFCVLSVHVALRWRKQRMAVDVQEACTAGKKAS